MGRAPVVVLWAEDDADDRLLLREAAAECRFSGDLRFVRDGAELLAYLRHSGAYADPSVSARPGLILLDLNMPGTDGRQALHEIKCDPDLRTIPVVVMTTSRAEEDVARCYELGAASYIAKPVTFQGLVEVLGVLAAYWMRMVRLP